MAAIPDGAQPNTAVSILRGYERSSNERHRLHLGASIIGGECARKLWYTLHWADREKLTGQKLRLFGSGHLQEPRLIEDLRRVGVQVEDFDPQGGQWTFRTLSGHFGCSMDAAALGLPEAPKTWHVCEFKGLNQKNFDKVVKEGCKKAKPEHHAQMMVNMGMSGMKRALYLVVNKNTDELHSERIEFDKTEFDRLVARAEGIIRATEPPARISDDPTKFPCGWSGKASGAGPGQCAFFNVCHGDQVPEVNCRTCSYSTAVLDGVDRKEGEWRCSNPALESAPVLSEPLQRSGCLEHRFIPIFLERTAKPVAFEHGVVVYQMNTDKSKFFGNGSGKQGSLTSGEIRACSGKSLLPEMCGIKGEFPGARVVA